MFFLDSTTTRELAFLNVVKMKDIEDFLNNHILYQQNQSRYVGPMSVGLDEMHFAQR